MEQQALTVSELLQATKQGQLVYSPVFFRLSNSSDKLQFFKLLEQPGIKVSNELHGQLRELVKLKSPKIKFSSTELDLAAHQYLKDKNIDADDYGVWVYYPWLNHVVHILEEEEYIELRTNRNQYKITPEERAILAQQKIGVLGLSVGQAVAVTLAMERSFGELRIADFDILELSNLNRIRSGTQDLGVMKTVSTARQIAEIDPYLKVVCFHDGLNEENIDAYFTEGGKLDIVVDECDGLDIKILARLKARELGVPVVMETSDRGMIDIERFDLEPDRPILHGLIEHLDQNPQNLKGLSNEEKIPYLLPMLGIDTMSDRLKASMLEVEQSVTTWPQLASDVVLGGAVSANVCRRMGLKQFEKSGRFFVDLNEIVSEENAHVFKFEEEKVATKEHLVINLKQDAKWQMALPGQLNLNQEQINTLVEAAIWAPSGGNSQPWKWLYEKQTLFLFLDTTKAIPFLDWADAGAYVSLGSATENLVLKAHQMGLEVKATTFPDKEDPTLAVAFQFFDKAANVAGEDHSYDDLVNNITTRLTNRLIRKREAIAPEQLNAIKAIAETVDGTKLHIISSAGQMEEIGKLLARTDRLLITNKQGHHGFVNEIRWSDEEAASTKDGLDIATIDLSAGEAAGFRMAKTWSVVQTLNKWGGGSVFEKLSTKCVEGAGALGLITMPAYDTETYYRSGRALERLWLYGNQNNIAMQPMTALLYLLHRVDHGNAVGLSAKEADELRDMEQKLRTTFKIEGAQWPVMLFRLLIADKPKVPSQRRPVEDVLIYKG